MLIATDLAEASYKPISACGGMKALGTQDALLTYCFNIRDVGSLADQLAELRRPSFEKQKEDA